MKPIDPTVSAIKRVSRPVLTPDYLYTDIIPKYNNDDNKYIENVVAPFYKSSEINAFPLDILTNFEYSRDFFLMNSVLTSRMVKRKVNLIKNGFPIHAYEHNIANIIFRTSNYVPQLTPATISTILENYFEKLVANYFLLYLPKETFLTVAHADPTGFTYQFLSEDYLKSIEMAEQLYGNSVQNKLAATTTITTRIVVNESIEAMRFLNEIGVF